MIVGSMWFTLWLTFNFFIYSEKLRRLIIEKSKATFENTLSKGAIEKGKFAIFYWIFLFLQIFYFIFIIIDDDKRLKFVIIL